MRSEVTKWLDDMWHKAQHELGTNKGTIETWWEGKHLMVGFRCLCGKMQGVAQTTITREDHHDRRDIRKKHEADKIRYTNSMWDRKWAVANSTLSIADVDSLFAALDSLREEASLYQKEWAKLRAALDEAKDGLTAAHMHGFE